MRVLLADDEPLALERLRVYFRDIPDVEVVGEAANGAEALAAIRSLAPDIVFLDIQMPELNGLRVAASLDEASRPEIVFITAFEHYAADAFTVEAADYLLKPVQFDRLWQAVERAKRRQYLRSLADAPKPGTEGAGDAEQGRVDGIWAQTRGRAVFVDTASIDWVEAQRDYVVLHTATKGYMVRMAMRTLEAKLDPEQLMRVHRSAFARASNVVEVQRMGKTINALVLRDGAIVPVGPNYARAVAQRLGLPS